MMLSSDSGRSRTSWLVNTGSSRGLWWDLDTHLPRRAVSVGPTTDREHLQTIVLASLNTVPEVREGEVEVDPPADDQGEEEAEDQLE